MRSSPDEDGGIDEAFTDDFVEFRMFLARTGCMDQHEKYVMLRFLDPYRFDDAARLIENWPDNRDPEDLKYALLDLIGEPDDRF